MKSTSPPDRRPSDAAGGRVAFRYPNFRYYMTARMLATIASEMQAVAVGWQIYALTHRALDLGLVGLAQFLPGVLLFLVAGQTADRFPRQRILQCCYVAFAGVSALLVVLTLHGLTTVWPVYAALVVNGVVRAFNGPASQAFLPLVVPEEVFPSAVALGSGVFQGAMVVGPMVGGLVYGLTGSPAPVYAGSIGACLSAMLLMGRIRVQAAQRPRGIARPGVLLDGLRYLWRAKMTLGAISLDMFAVLLGGAVALMPVYAKDILGVGATGLGANRMPTIIERRFRIKYQVSLNKSPLRKILSLQATDQQHAYRTDPPSTHAAAPPV